MSISSSSDLKVELVYPPNKPWYAPGETIVGCVSRTTSGVTPDARVILTLHGISKTKIVVSQGEHNAKYKSSFNCLSAPVEAQLLHANGPLHIPEGSEGVSWPFAITIPSLVTDVRQSHDKKYYAQPGSPEGAPFPPPGSFEFHPESMFTRQPYEASIRYHVQARLELSHEHRGRPKKKCHTATATIPLRNVSLDPPIADFDLQEHRTQHTIGAYRLVPGMGGLSLSFLQKIKQAFTSSSVPRLTFNTNIRLPRRLQAKNTAPLPLNLSIEPVLASTSEILHNVPQQIIIKSFTLRLTPWIHIQAEKRSLSKLGENIDLVPPGAVAAFPHEICLTVTPGAASPPPPLNLGELINLNLALLQNLDPSFETYNIRRTYSLAFQLEGTVVDQRFKLEERQKVIIMPASYRPSYAPDGGDNVSGYTRGADELPAYE